MSGFCGWFVGTGADRVAEAFEPVRALDAMADGLPRFGEMEAHSTAEAAHALALKASPVAGGWYEEQGLTVALEGYPEWSDPELAAVSAEWGSGAALARAYRRLGTELFEHLRGPFSFALLDRGAGRALLAIDRFGVRAMCYGSASDGALVFGSTADSVRAHPGMTATIRPQALFDYLYFIDRIPAPDTVYGEQRKLLPGQYLQYESGRVETGTYWRMPYAEAGDAGIENPSEKLLGQLRAALARSVRGEELERVGTFLSGGLDSSTVLALLAERAPRPPRSFTIGFDTQGYDETEYAKLASHRFGGPHDIYVLRPQDVLDAIPRVSQIYDEPFANSSAIPAYFCALRAKEAGIEMMLAGDGGDELFAGNARYLKDNVFDHYQRIPGPLRRSLVEPAVAAMASFGGSGLARRAANYVRRARLSVPERLTEQNVFAATDPTGMFAREFLEAVDLGAPARLAEEIYAGAPSAEKLNRMMYLDLRLTLADSDLRKVGVMCELAGVRVRYPFLDEDLAAFAARIPPKQMLRGGELRGFFKYALRDFLPPEILSKPKHGFGLPYLELVNSYAPLNELTRDSLSALKSFGCFQPGYLDGLIDEVRAGRSDAHGGVAWDLMVLAQWLDSRSLLSSSC
ncbi:MAG: asparagine synthetase B family protein [Alphaproteobacteria bacterium]